MRVLLYNNKIEIIGQNILSPLKNLEMINLAENLCINESALDSSAFQSIIDTIHSSYSNEPGNNYTEKNERLEAKLKTLEESLQLAISRIAKMEEKIYIFFFQMFFFFAIRKF